MSKYEHWNYKYPRTAEEYSHNCWRRTEENSRRIDIGVWTFLVFATGFFLGTLVVKIAIELAI